MKIHRDTNVKKYLIDSIIGLLNVVIEAQNPELETTRIFSSTVDVHIKK